jgi:metal-responsive CopG/Arc/MetJ family transcriptional regulator
MKKMPAKKTGKRPPRSISVSLPESVIEQLEDRSISNRRGQTEGSNTVSGIVREILASAGFYDRDPQN